MSSKYDATDRLERSKRFGIDCGDGLEWQGGTWVPGGEYIKKLVVKNVSSKLQKIRYKLPESKIFSMPFPDPIRLAAGVSVSIEVRFRPIRLEDQEDGVEFSTENGKFFVPFRARLSKLAGEVPDRVDFSFCPVNETTPQPVEVRNVGEIPLEFQWACKQPFTIEPMIGQLAPGALTTVTAFFSPKEGCVCEGEARLTIRPDKTVVEKIAPQTINMQLYGIGKFPYIVADKSDVDFGDVLVGTLGPSVTKTFVVSNPSLVRASIRVEHHEEDRKHEFSLQPLECVIPAGGSQEFHVRYHPLYSGLYTTDHFDLITPAGPSIHMRFSARTAMPEITLMRKPPAGTRTTGSLRSVNFGDIKIGSEMTQVITLKNYTNRAAFFHFQCEPGGIFKLSQAQGEVPAGLETHVVVRFAPEQHGNFYRRLFCLIQDGPVLFIDMLGTAYDDQQRPAPLKQKHVDMFRLRPQKLKRMNPDHLLERIKASPDQQPPVGKQERLLEQEYKQQDPTRSGETVRSSIAAAKEHFKGFMQKSAEVTVSDETIDFGQASPYDLPPKKTVQITNRTSGRMTVVWQIPDSVDGDDELDWEVIPPAADVLPGQSTSFSIAFRPTQEDFYYGQELEAYAFYKQNRTFRLVDDETFTPPWLLAVRVHGHTFQNTGQFLPKIQASLPGSIGEYSLAMPPVLIGDSVYQTFKLFNHSDTPAYYYFKTDNPHQTAGEIMGGIFTVKPAAGLIMLNNFQLVTVRFSPRAARSYRTQLVAIINNDASSGNTFRLDVSAAAYMPRMTLPDGNQMFFRPTAVGIVSKRKYRLHNPTRIPCRYMWRIPRSHAHLVHVSPSEGTLQGNDHVDLEWSFAPREKRVYSFSVQCSIYSGGEQAKTARAVQHLTLNIVGEAAPAALHFDPPAINFGTALVGTGHAKKFVVENKSSADLAFRLRAFMIEDVAEATPHDGHRSAGGADEESKVDETAAPAEPQWVEVKTNMQPRAAAADQADSGKGKGKGKAGDEPIVEFTPNDGHVEAHSRKTIKVRFRPRQAARYRIRLCYELVSQLDDEGVRPALEGGVQKGEDSMSTALKAPIGGDWLRGAPLNMDPVWCEVVGIGGYPVAAFEDARALSAAVARVLMPVRKATRAASVREAASAGGDRESTSGSLISGPGGSMSLGGRMGGGGVMLHPALTDKSANPMDAGGRLVSKSAPWTLWRQFMLRDLNECLSLPLTPAERRFNKQTQLQQKPEKLAQFIWEFTPATFGSDPMMVLLNLRNPSKLPLHFHFAFASDMEVELETWAEAGEPSELDMLRERLLEHKVFGIRPRKGTLKPGDAVTIRAHYGYHSSLNNGVHEVPVIMKIGSGKAVRITMRGTTLAPDTPRLFSGFPTGEYRLASVPLGVPAAPVQSVPIMNPSAVDVHYTVLPESVEAMTRENYGFHIFKVGVESGILTAGEQAVIPVIFHPLEAKTYRMPLKIRFDTAPAGRGARPSMLTTVNEQLEEETPLGGGVREVEYELVAEGYHPEIQHGEYLEPVPADVAPAVAETVEGIGLRAGYVGADASGLEDALEESIGGDEEVHAADAEKQLQRVLGVLGQDQASTSAIFVQGKRAAPVRDTVQLSRYRPGEAPATYIGRLPPLLRLVELPAAVAPDVAAEVPDGLASLALERINFGPIPCGAVSHRVFILRSNRTRGALLYRWDRFHPAISNGVVRVHPASGRLDAGEQVVVRMTLWAELLQPEIFEEDIGCTVMIPEDEVQMDSEQRAAAAHKATIKAQRKAERNPGSVPDKPHESVVYKATQARLAALEADAIEADLRGVNMQIARTGTDIRTGRGRTLVPQGMDPSAGTAFGGGSSVGGGGTVASFLDGQGRANTAGSRSVMSAGRTSTASGGSKRMSLTARKLQESTLPDVFVPPCPSAVLFMHVSGRVMDVKEFGAAYGPQALEAFHTPSRANDAGTQSTAGAKQTGTAATAQSITGNAASAIGDRAVLEDVLSSVLADLVSDQNVGLALGQSADDSAIPLFGQITTPRNAPPQAPQPVVVDSAKAEAREKHAQVFRERNSALSASECKELVAKAVENVVLNLIRETAHEEFDITTPPVQVIRKY